MLPVLFDLVSMSIQTCTFDENLEKLKGNYDCRFEYADKDREKNKTVINSENITKSLHDLEKSLDDITVSVAVSGLRQILLKISEDSFQKIKTDKSKHQKISKKFVPWMDYDCKQLKCELKASRKQYQEAIKLDFENSLRLTLRDSYLKNRRNYHKLCRKEERKNLLEQATTKSLQSKI